MLSDSPVPHRRIFSTPRGTAELDIAGNEGQSFVTVTVFDDEGWARDEDVWWSGHDDGLAERVAGLTGMSAAEADAAVGDFLSTWERRGGRAQAAAMTRRFRAALVATSVAIAGVAGGLAWAVGRRRTGRVPRREGRRRLWPGDYRRSPDSKA